MHFTEDMPMRVNGGGNDSQLKGLGPAWQHPSSSGADFRSECIVVSEGFERDISDGSLLSSTGDIVTTPTLSMLHAALEASLNDAFDESPSQFESYVAALTGNEDALFCVSGTMANQIALRSLLTQPPMAILADHRSHILNMEAGGIASFAGALFQPVIPANGVYLTLVDIQRCIVLDESIYSCPTRVISLEIPHAGAIMPLSELRAIARFARCHGVRLHIDGARLWQVAAAGAGSLREFCTEVDSVSMCFTKGLCAPAGSILVGSKTLIRQARRVRKSIGGAMRQPGIAMAIAAAGLIEVFGVDGSASKSGLLRKTHTTARELANVWTQLGGRITMPVETNMVCLDLAAAGIDESDWVRRAAARGLRLRGSRIVTHCRKFVSSSLIFRA